jgi:hypothetical protein
VSYNDTRFFNFIELFVTSRVTSRDLFLALELTLHCVLT